MRYRHARKLRRVRLCEIKGRLVSGHILSSIQSLARAGSARAATSGPMQKFALKLLLTSLAIKRRSKRIDGAQFVASLLTLVVLVAVGLYIWSRGPY